MLGAEFAAYLRKMTILESIAVFGGRSASTEIQLTLRPRLASPSSKHLEVQMSDFAYGFWGTVDNSLQYIGKGTARLLTRNSGTAEDVAYAAVGGSLLCAAVGAVMGFALSDLSRSMATVEGAVVGLLLGACVGVFFGSFVEAVDEYIRNLLGSLRMK